MKQREEGLPEAGPSAEGTSQVSSGAARASTGRPQGEGVWRGGSPWLARGCTLAWGHGLGHFQASARFLSQPRCSHL